MEATIKVRREGIVCSVERSKGNEISKIFPSLLHLVSYLGTSAQITREVWAYILDNSLYSGRDRHHCFSTRTQGSTD
jgi:hypothetical protein